jgi:hypothetical protein
MQANLQTTKHYPRKVEKVPSPSKPCGQARRKLKKIKERARSTHVLAYPTSLKKRGGRTTSPLTPQAQLNKQIKKKSALLKLEKD